VVPAFPACQLCGGCGEIPGFVLRDYMKTHPLPTECIPLDLPDSLKVPCPECQPDFWGVDPGEAEVGFALADCDLCGGSGDIQGQVLLDYVKARGMPEPGSPWHALPCPRCQPRLWKSDDDEP
jgi:hypothetical protein